MQIDFPDIGLSEAELTLELAVALFQQKKISLGKAAEVAGMSHVEFQHILAERNIVLHYDLADLDEDICTLQQLGRLPE
ncbi:MAG: UPF0175 family protein [Ktedonobacteraceae bacterium]|nr:UPF0175 family protein [Ktedonobacteraceae bacterium]